jgi:phosphoesterase RecJ-like protein
VNADGDGAGSEAALAHYLTRRGLRPTIVNPTAFPEQFRFLLGDFASYTPREEEGRRALDEADLVLVLDTSEPSRLGGVFGHLEGRKVAVLDHHPPTPTSLGDLAVVDPTACATGELVFDLLTTGGRQLELPEAQGLYVAVATDTGSFRYANTNSRTHQIAAQLLDAGVNPEEMYRRLYARYTSGSLDLVRRALSRLRMHKDKPVAWIRLTQADLAQTGTAKDDLEGIVEYARRIQGVEVALLFREMADGRTKVSLRSTGDTDVAAIARGLGGGGHAKAAGVVVDLGLDAAQETVVEAVCREL